MCSQCQITPQNGKWFSKSTSVSDDKKQPNKLIRNRQNYFCSIEFYVNQCAFNIGSSTNAFALLQLCHLEFVQSMAESRCWSFVNVVRIGFPLISIDLWFQSHPLMWVRNSIFHIRLVSIHLPIFCFIKLRKILNSHILFHFFFCCETGLILKVIQWCVRSLNWFQFEAIFEFHFNGISVETSSPTGRSSVKVCYLIDINLQLVYNSNIITNETPQWNVLALTWILGPKAICVMIFYPISK